MLDNVDLQHLNEYKRKVIKEVLLEFEDVFQDPKDNVLGCTSEVKHRIHVDDARPIKRNPYHLPHKYKKVVKDMLKKHVR